MILNPFLCIVGMLSAGKQRELALAYNQYPELLVDWNEAPSLAGLYSAPAAPSFF